MKVWCLLKSCVLGQVGDHDESKRVCGMNSSMLTSAECVVVSIGSNNQWQFEVFAFQSLPCKIVTFDCTSQDSMPEFIRPRTTFYRICVGVQDEIRSGRQSMTWESRKIAWRICLTVYFTSLPGSALLQLAKACGSYRHRFSWSRWNLSPASKGHRGLSNNTTNLTSFTMWNLGPM